MASSSASASAARGSAVGGSGPSGSASVGSEAPTEVTDIRAPLWDHVTVLERTKSGGGNVLWRCKYCSMEKATSYTRVEAHLLQKTGKGISKCPKVSYELLSEMRREVQRCKELVEKEKTHPISLPTAPAPSDNHNSTKKNKRGPASILEKAWALQDRKHLDALLARAFYSGGTCCKNLSFICHFI